MYCRPNALATVSLISIALLAISLGVAGCASEAPEPTTPKGDLARIQEEGKLVALVVPHQESIWVKTNLEGGPMKRVGTTADFIGLDVDLMAAFADRLGVELEIRPAVGPEGLPGYGHLIPALLAEQGDVIASSFSITPERQQKIDYSEPYFSVFRAVVARIDSGIDASMNLEGKRPSVVAGSSQEAHLLAFGFDPQEIQHGDFQLENYAAVLDGEADFTLQDSASAEKLVSQYEELHIVGPLSDERDPYGFGVRKESDLKDELNRFITEIRANGELKRILAKSHLTLAH